MVYEWQDRRGPQAFNGQRAAQPSGGGGSSPTSVSKISALLATQTWQMINPASFETTRTSRLCRPQNEQTTSLYFDGSCITRSTIEPTSLPHVRRLRGHSGTLAQPRDPRPERHAYDPGVIPRRNLITAGVLLLAVQPSLLIAAFAVRASPQVRNQTFAIQP